MVQGRDFSQTLDEALDRLNAGESIEECLTHYPGVAHELEPLLRAACMVKEQAEIPLPPDMEEWLTVGRCEIETLARQRLSRRAFVFAGEQAPRPLPRRPFAPFFRGLSYHRIPRFAVVALAALMLVFVTSAINTASASSLPGDVLYPWKLTRETVTLALTPDPADRSLLRVEYANHRVTELQALVNGTEGSDPADITRTIDLLGAQISSAIDEANQAGTGPEIHQQLSGVLESADSTLAQAINQTSAQPAPPAVRPSATSDRPAEQTALPQLAAEDEERQALEDASQKIDTLKRELPRLAISSPTVPAGHAGAPTALPPTARVVPPTATLLPSRTPRRDDDAPDVAVPPADTGELENTRPSPTATALATRVPSPTASATTERQEDQFYPPLSMLTSTPTIIPAQPSPTIAATPTNTPAPTRTNTPVPATSTPVPTWTNTPVATVTSVPTLTETSIPTATVTDTPRPTRTNTPRPTWTNTPVPTATETVTPTLTNTPTVTPSVTPSSTATPTPSATPTETPTPTPTPSATPTEEPTLVARSQRVFPLLECIAPNEDGSFRAYFGYENLTEDTVTIPYGSDNNIVPRRYNRLQPEEFPLPNVIDDLPGRTGSYPDGPAFFVDFKDTEEVAWTLDGVTVIATVLEDADAPVIWCEEPIEDGAENDDEVHTSISDPGTPEIDDEEQDDLTPTATPETEPTPED